MTTNNNTQTNTLERIAMNIVYQIGDALDEKIKEGKDIVTARQETNDMCIDFTKNLINEMVEKELDRLVTSFEVKNGIAPHLSPVRDFLKQYLLERKNK